MQITPDKIESFINSLSKRLTEELKEAKIEVKMQSHYPDPPFTEVDDQIYPYPAIGETVALQIGICPEVNFKLWKRKNYGLGIMFFTKTIRPAEGCVLLFFEVSKTSII